MSTTLAPATFRALGTNATVAVTDPAASGLALAVAQEEIRAFDSACSRFRPDSELTMVNAAAGTAVTVSALLIEAVELALRAAGLTGGRVTPTVGRTMRVLGYDHDFGALSRSGPALRVQVAPLPPASVVHIDRQASTIRVPHGVELDLGATAKAFCADRAARAITRATGSGALVSLGGDIATSGTAPSNGWAVQISDDHASPLGGPDETVALHTGGLATSGTTVRRWQRGSVSLHHLVDPSTGVPAQTRWRTATVAAASCADANIAATASIILDAEAPAWLARRELPARLVANDGSVTLVGAWPSSNRS